MFFPCNERRALSLAAGYFLFFFFFSLEYTYLPTFFLNRLHFSGKEVALIYTGITLLNLISQPFWGQIADSTQKTAGVIRCCSALGLLSSLSLIWRRDFLAMTLCLWSMAFFINCVPPLIDSIAVSRFGVKRYGKIRVGGSLGYGCSALAFAACPLEWIIYAVVGCMGLCLAGSFFIGEEPRAPNPRRRGIYALELLRRPSFLLLAALGIFHWASALPYHIMLNVHRENLSLPPIVTGYAVATAIACECAIIATAGRWLSAMAPLRWLTVAASFTALRWLVMGHATSASAIVAVQSLHAFTYGMFYVASISRLTEIVPEEMRASGQTLFVAFTFGLGSVIGNIYTGIVYDLPLPPAERGFCVFTTAVLFSLVALVIVGWMNFSERKSHATRE